MRSAARLPRPGAPPPARPAPPARAAHFQDGRGWSPAGTEAAGGVHGAGFGGNEMPSGRSLAAPVGARGRKGGAAAAPQGPRRALGAERGRRSGRAPRGAAAARRPGWAWRKSDAAGRKGRGSVGRGRGARRPVRGGARAGAWRAGRGAGLPGAQGRGYSLVGVSEAGHRGVGVAGASGRPRLPPGTCQPGSGPAALGPGVSAARRGVPSLGAWAASRGPRGWRRSRADAGEPGRARVAGGPGGCHLLRLCGTGRRCLGVPPGRAGGGGAAKLGRRKFPCPLGASHPPLPRTPGGLKASSVRAACLPRPPAQLRGSFPHSRPQTPSFSGLQTLVSPRTREPRGIPPWKRMAQVSGSLPPVWWRPQYSQSAPLREDCGPHPRD